jgi:2-polyprenyl-3-methyl-5-hydroxy-6-metoxy-1,4-benzoquinol methylase
MERLLQDQIANLYYDTTARRSHSASLTHYEDWSRAFLRHFKPWLPKDQNAVCLDLACGCGEFLHLLEWAGYANTSGVDLCQEELTQARPYVKGSLVHANVLDHLKTLETKSHDFITALNFLEHLSKDELLATLNECRRVLRPGGTLVAMVPNAISPFGSVTRYWDITHEWAFTPNNFHQLAALTRFDSTIDFRECGPIPHGLLSGGRYLLWRTIRCAIALWFLIEVGTLRSSVFTMDMLVRLHLPLSPQSSQCNP